VSCDNCNSSADGVATASDKVGACAAGMWVFVVGPSGAGKDTLMDIARDQLRDCPRIVFARRIVTRFDTTFEDHDTASEADFRAMLEAGELALDWQAHGLFYGIHRCWRDAVNSGRIVVCNISRAIIPKAVRHFSHVSVVLITAPDDILAIRIAGRGRDQAAGSRIARNINHVAEAYADIIIDNAGAAVDGANQLQQHLRKLNGLSCFASQNTETY